jgi:hypothetical protein
MHRRGRLIDEDFPPLTLPYSETSSATSGNLSYGAIDVGYSVVRQPSFRLVGFVGYGRWNWWHLDTNAVDIFQQLETYRTDRYGVLLQGSYRLN